ncbi:MAG: energy transducer TonB, partial [Planctomyces sp.]
QAAADIDAPASPIVEIHIRKSGQIADVKIIRSSGYPAEIDEPIRNAIFFWRASGPELSGLSDDPDARFVVRLTFNLR